MAARSNAVVTQPGERELTIERIFDAPRELVFKCWTDPEHLVRWIGPKGFSGTNCARAEIFARTCVGPTARIIGNRASSAKSFRPSELSGRMVGRTPTAGRRGPRPC